jgi:hypothetical protein
MSCVSIPSILISLEISVLCNWNIVKSGVEDPQYGTKLSTTLTATTSTNIISISTWWTGARKEKVTRYGLIEFYSTSLYYYQFHPSRVLKYIWLLISLEISVLCNWNIVKSGVEDPQYGTKLSTTLLVNITRCISGLVTGGIDSSRGLYYATFNNISVTQDTDLQWY